MKKANQTFVFIFVLSLFFSYTTAQLFNSTLFDQFLSEMNDARRNVNPPANPPLQDLVYNSTLSEIAYNAFFLCVKNDSYPISQFGTAFSLVSSENVTAVINDFKIGAQYYNYLTNTCDGPSSYYDRYCNYYTQIVSSKSTQVGCATASCIIHVLGVSYNCLFDYHANFTIERPYSIDGTGGSVSSTSIPSTSIAPSLSLVPSTSIAPSSSSSSSSRSVCVNCGRSCKLNSFKERCNSLGGRVVRGQRKLCCEFLNGVPSPFTFTWKTGRVCDDNKQKKLQTFCNALVGSTSCDSGLWSCSK